MYLCKPPQGKETVVAVLSPKRQVALSKALRDQSGAHENTVCYKAGSAKIVSIVGSTVSGAAGGNGTFCSTYT